MRQDANLQQSDPTTLVHYILAGARKMPTDRSPTPLSMPAFYWKLDDAPVAAVATYARNSWGNAADPVTADQVKKLRAALKLEHVPPPKPQPTDLTHPGPNTWASAGTDSRQNGTPSAGQPAPAKLEIPTAAAMGNGPSKRAATPESASSPAGKPKAPPGGSGDVNQHGSEGSPGGSTGGPG
jgi:hypothetical protein